MKAKNFCLHFKVDVPSADEHQQYAGTIFRSVGTRVLVQYLSS